MNLFEAVKANVNAADVAAMAGLHPNRNKMICCPFHNDRHPSMKVDKRYYCFGCGAKGDAIDFVANYYGLNPRAAAEKIASDFAIPYDNVWYSDHFQKNIAVKKNEHQIWAEKKRCLYERLSALHEKLRQIKTEYAPKTREESTWDPLFSLAVNEFTYVDYLYEYCMFEATDAELQQKYEKITKEIENIEKRIYDTESGTGGSAAGQIGERVAV